MPTPFRSTGDVATPPVTVADTNRELKCQDDTVGQSLKFLVDFFVLFCFNFFTPGYRTAAPPVT